MLQSVSVSDFLKQINEIVLGVFVVEGEIAHHTVSQNKWIFFDLKDNVACLNCFSTVYMLKEPLEDGMRVRVTGYPKIHEKSGRFSFTVQKIELVGDGTLKRAYQLLKNKLTVEGLFAAARKRPLPYLPGKIGVITSAEAAAYGDFKRILANRWGGLEIFLYPSAVQGESAIGDIVKAFHYFNEAADVCDVLVLIRGGGSMEDLAAFNSEAVARAVGGSRIPVVVGVGHERDETLADLAADVRASTPSNAAEIIVPEKTIFLDQLASELELMEGALLETTLRRAHATEQWLAFLTARLEAPFGAAKLLVDRFARQHDRLLAEVGERQAFVKATEVLLNNVNPKQVLKRGYSITRNAQGAIVKAGREVDNEERIMIELAEDTVAAFVRK